jgi:hypothetical protein
VARCVGVSQVRYHSASRATPPKRGSVRPQPKMPVLMTALGALAASVLVIWVLSALGILMSFLRAQRAALAKGLSIPPLGLRDLSGIPSLALLSTMDVIWSAGRSCGTGC